MSGNKAVIVISSHVIRGSVGNRAAVFALESLGLPVWAVQTITLPWHPGHGPATRLVPDEKQFASVIDDLCQSPWLPEVGAVLTGYLGDPSQAKAIKKLVMVAREKNPDLVYLCDPVIGDQHGLYVSEDTVTEIKENLLPIADITTPNRFELSSPHQSACKLPEFHQSRLHLSGIPRLRLLFCDRQEKTFVLLPFATLSGPRRGCSYENFPDFPNLSQ